MVWVRQVPFDEDHIHERTYNASDRWGHEGNPEPVVVTPGEQTPSENNDAKRLLYV